MKMTRDWFKGFAQEILEAVAEVDDIFDSGKAGLNHIRICVTDAVEELENDRDACVADCAHRLAEKIRQGGRRLSFATDNWTAGLRPVKSGP